MFEILRRLFWGAYFHICFRVLKKIPFSRSVKSKFPSLVCPRLHIFKLKNEKAPYRGRGDTPLPHPAPARSLRSLGLGRFAPSQTLCPPKLFGSLRHCRGVLTPNLVGIFCTMYVLLKAKWKLGGSGSSSSVNIYAGLRSLLRALLEPLMHTYGEHFVIAPPMYVVCTLFRQCLTLTFIKSFAVSLINFF